MPEIAENVAPVSVEWNRPLSVETQTSPVTAGLTTILTGAVDEPSVPFTLKVDPPSEET